MTPTYRRPLRRVTSNGAEIPRVLGARIVRGWDQMLARADITVPYPPPAGLGKGAKVTISGGVTSMPLRFTGYVTGYGAELWPGTWSFPCEDALWLTTFYRPATTHDLSNKTDQAAIVYIFTLMGLVFNPGAILGTGKKIGSNASAALTWGPDTTALEMIRRIDEVSIVDHGGGQITQFRTWADFGGQIRRSEIANLPGTTAARTFTEGSGIGDIEQGTVRVTAREPSTSVTAIGDGVSSVVTGTNPWAITPNPWSYLYPMLQQSSGSDLTTALVAQFMLQRLNLNLVTIDFKTPREDLVGPFDTVGFDSDHVRLTLNTFVQSVETGWFEDGEFSQQLTLISARELNTNDTVTPGAPGSVIGPPPQFDPFTGAPIPPGGPGDIPPPIPDSVIAAFEVLYLDVELVLIADVETSLYTAVCRDVSTASGGTIATRAWTTAGSATPATGSDQNFNPSWTDLTGASVTLTVTDSLANVSAPLTITISQSMGVPVRTQDLFSAETGALAAFSGADRTWRTFTTGVGAAIVVANGPLWGDGDKVWRTADCLATPALSSVPSAGVDVVSIWTELDLDANAVAVGLANGQIALSSDAAATWIVKDGPDMPEPVLKVIISRFDGSIQAITATGYWVSTNAGDTWTLIRAGDYRDLDLNQFRSWAIEVTGGVGGMIEAVSGAAITGSGADDLVAVTSHILADRGISAAADGSAYFLAEDGDTALTAGAAVPAGTPQHRGMYRTAAPDIVLAAVGTGGVVKTTDGGRATWYYLRKPGVAGAGAGPFTMIGAGGLQALAPVEETARRVYVFGASPNALYKSTDGGLTYTEVTGHGVGGIVAFDVLGGASGQDIIVVSGGTSMAMSTDGGATWAALTALPTTVAHISIVSAAAIFASGTGPTIYKSADGGATWPTWSTAGDSTNIWATSGAIWVSTTNQQVKRRYDHDHGSLVTVNHAAAGNLTPLHAASDDICFLAKGESSGINAVLMLDGSGASYTDITPTGAITGRWFDAYSNDGGTTIIALIQDYDNAGAAVGQLWRSVDSGSNWAKVAEDVQLQPSGADTSKIGYLAAAGSTWVCAGGDSDDGSADSVVWYSTDNGVSWASATVAAGQTDLGPIRVASG